MSFLQVGSDGTIRVKQNGIVIAGAGDPCCCGEDGAEYVQARLCADDSYIDYWRVTTAFAFWGGSLPLPYYFILPGGGCAYFSDNNIISTEPGTILGGEVQASGCDDPACADDLYLQSFRCEGGLRNAFKRRSDFVPWGGSLPLPYHWVRAGYVGNPKPCGFFSLDSPETTLPGFILSDETQIPLCGDDPRCGPFEYPNPCDTIDCPPTAQIEILGTGIPGMDAVHSLNRQANGTYYKAFSDGPEGWGILLQCGVISQSPCMEQWTVIAVNGTANQPGPGGRIDGVINGPPCVRCAPAGLYATTFCSRVDENGVPSDCSGSIVGLPGANQPCEPCVIPDEDGI